ncbi:hypothetical protein V9K67_12125 [Paraflavisolibacter sp. H34]|uniref:hypothetical protein n=1 Tax=Huijunlia imazamoxiresistens TaxID=3127457 RepID=UPI003016A15B
MDPNNKYSNDLPLEEKVLYVLSLFQKGTAEEVATELMELQEVTTEEGVAGLKIEVQELLKKLAAEGKISLGHEADGREVYTDE